MHAYLWFSTFKKKLQNAYTKKKTTNDNACNNFISLHLYLPTTNENTRTIKTNCSEHLYSIHIHDKKYKWKMDNSKYSHAFFLPVSENILIFKNYSFTWFLKTYSNNYCDFIFCLTSYPVSIDRFEQTDFRNTWFLYIYKLLPVKSPLNKSKVICQLAHCTVTHDCTSIT